MQSNQLVNFANEFDFLPDLARVAGAAAVPGPPCPGKALGAAGALLPFPFPFPVPCPRPAAPLPRPAARAVPACPRARSPAQGRPRARCCRCRQVGVTLGPALAPAARSAVRESRGAALRSTLSPHGRRDGGTGPRRRGDPGHQVSPGCGDRERPEPPPQPRAGGSGSPSASGAPQRGTSTECQFPLVRPPEPPRTPHRDNPGGCASARPRERLSPRSACILGVSAVHC